MCYCCMLLFLYQGDVKYFWQYITNRLEWSSVLRSGDLRHLILEKFHP